jgi:hypothetical protein
MTNMRPYSVGFRAQTLAGYDENLALNEPWRP